MGAAKGCCCGVLVGILLVLILSGAIGFGVYLWMNPEARATFVERLDQGWDAAKDGGDKMMDGVKQVSGELPAAPKTSNLPAMPKAN